MKNFTKASATGLVLLSVAACGSSGTVVGPETVNVEIPATFTVTRASPTSVTFSDGTTDFTLNQIATAVNGGYVWFNSAGTEVLMSVDETSILAKQGASYGDLLGAILVREETTTVPSVGTATYSGFSAAYLVGGGVDNSAGEVTMNVNFDANTIDGLIENRTEFSSGIGSRGDILLNAGTISGGSFTGTTTGGYLSGAQAGSYSGIFTGADGEGLVGEWHYDDGANKVQGVFNADKTP